MRVLLSVKPGFASAIFSGEKQFEFRRSIFRKPVTRVIVYASAPVSKVVGEFEIEELLHEELDHLWQRTNPHGGITKEFFFSYFSGKEKGYAIRVKNPQLYDTPLCPKLTYGKHPPQSFVYLEQLLLSE